jgi:hypothetical protein
MKVDIALKLMLAEGLIVAVHTADGIRYVLTTKGRASKL